jgi:hypothetical protein
VGTGLGYLSDWTDGSYPPTHNIPNEVYDSSDDVYWTPIPTSKPGQAMFILNPNGPETNIWQGSISLSNNVVIPGSSAYSMISSPIPYIGDVAQAPVSLTANFTSSELLFVWNGSGYYAYYYWGAGVGTGLGYPSDWADASYPPTHNIPGEVYDSSDDIWWTLPVTNNIGQGFFMLNPHGSAINWTQVFNNNN